MSRPLRSGRASSAVAAVEAPVRCGVYCRKSTTEGLDSAFSSLDNQRRAAEAYIASQRHEGWSAVTDRYDDGGFSGGNTDRPALQRLLADAKARRIDTIVVYRLDRLSRSLIDFLHIHEDLERWGVGLVSVTEHINTTTPHGRMMVNVLLSFAQYERELIGERTRDKIHAARRLGRWTGGTPPLGYDVAPEGGRLVPNMDEASQVRAIFDLYLERRGLVPVAQELTRRGWRKKSWTTRNGKHRQGGDWNNVYVHHLLTDPIYTGQQKLGAETFKGEHPAIVSKATFDKVQRILGDNCRTGGSSQRNRHGALLRGILRCAACDSAMTHTFTKHRKLSFRYYRCVHAIKNGKGSCPTGSVPAAKIEEFVVEQIRRIGSDPALCEETFRRVQAQVAAEQRELKSEAKRVAREHMTGSHEVTRLTSTLTRATGAAADAIMAKLSESQERVRTLERRQREVAERLQGVTLKAIAPESVSRALAQFTDVWTVLRAPERERVVRLLIERIDFAGPGQDVKISFSATGARLLVADHAAAGVRP